MNLKEEILQAIHSGENQLPILRKEVHIMEDRLHATGKQIIRHLARNQKATETLEARVRRPHTTTVSRQDWKAKAILETLRFDRIEARRDDITEAAQQTFQWAVSNRRSPPRNWLESGAGICWISGKPGAGKSTLMKFLTGQDEVRSRLETWTTATAKNNRLIIIKHYF